MVNCKFIGRTEPFFTFFTFFFFFHFFILFTSDLFCATCPGEGGRFNHFKYFENHKSYVTEFLHGYTSRWQILIWACKIFAGFSRYFLIKRFKVMMLKARKIQLLKIFHHQNIPKNGAQWNQNYSVKKANEK